MVRAIVVIGCIIGVWFMIYAFFAPIGLFVCAPFWNGEIMRFLLAGHSFPELVEFFISWYVGLLWNPEYWITSMGVTLLLVFFILINSFYDSKNRL
ncbi:MAG: hypothetical protein ACFFCI_00660 [Promethearchaeota archaeon]